MQKEFKLQCFNCGEMIEDWDKCIKLRFNDGNGDKSCPRCKSNDIEDLELLMTQPIINK